MGTYSITGSRGSQQIAKALGLGYTYLDSAQMYGNEGEVGKGISLAGVEREDVFVLTKVHPENIGRKDFLPSVEKSLRNLGMGHVDLLLIHWPNPRIPVEEAVEELMKAKTNGYTRYIGVSNFNISQVRTALDMGAEIVTNQVEYHCLINQQKLLGFLRENGVSLTAYSPLAKGRLAGNPTLKRIGWKYTKSEAQVALGWLIAQDNVVAIPRSSNEKRLADNLEVFDFLLTEEDNQAIGALSNPSHRLTDWHYSPVWD